jgi:hypothetical protein
VKKPTFSILTVLAILAGCADNNAVTRAEIETQNRADAVVSGLLFDKSLDNAASYNIRKNGFVVIKFDESVSERSYTEIVNALRSSPGINGVRAEQSGGEVCPLR